MICFKCQTQMKQYKGLGGGQVTPDGLNYITWEIKVCPKCGVIVREYYSAEVLSEYQLQEYINESKSKGTPKED